MANRLPKWKLLETAPNFGGAGEPCRAARSPWPACPRVEASARQHPVCGRSRIRKAWDARRRCLAGLVQVAWPRAGKSRRALPGASRAGGLLAGGARAGARDHPLGNGPRSGGAMPDAPPGNRDSQRSGPASACRGRRLAAGRNHGGAVALWLSSGLGNLETSTRTHARAKRREIRWVAREFGTPADRQTDSRPSTLPRRRPRALPPVNGSNHFVTPQKGDFRWAKDGRSGGPESRYNKGTRRCARLPKRVNADEPAN